MCKSLKDGGGRCYSHTSKAYIKAQENEQNCERQLEKYRRSVEQISRTLESINSSNDVVNPDGVNNASIQQSMRDLDDKLEREEITNEEYNASMERLEYYRSDEFRQSVQDSYEYGQKLIERTENQLNERKAETQKAYREMNTTYTGLKKLQELINSETGPVKKRELQVEYNASKRLGIKRKNAFVRNKENRHKAQKLREKAKLNYESAKTINLDSPESVEAYKELIFEGQKLEAQAYLKENNGHTESQVLIDAKTKQYVPAKIVHGKYGLTWMLLNEKGEPTNQFISPPRGKTMESRAKYWENKGLKLGVVSVPGEIDISDNPDGSKKVSIKRSDNGFDKNAILVDGDKYATLLKKK